MCVVGRGLWSHDIFLFARGDRFVVYAPLRGMILEVNAALVDTLNRAKAGDPEAAAQLQAASPDLGELLAPPPPVPPAPCRPFAPTRVSLILTSDCTMRCRYCYFEAGTRPRTMSPMLADAVLRYVVDNAVRAGSRAVSVSYHGGDVGAAWPVFVSSRETLARLSERHGLECSASLGVGGVLDAAQRRYVAEHIADATVSIDGTPEIHNAHRVTREGRASFEAVDAMIRELESRDRPYAIRMTTTAASVGRLAECVEFVCQRYRVRVIQAEPVFPSGHAKQGPAPPAPEEFVERFRDARRVAQHYRRELRFSPVRPHRVSGTFCGAVCDSFVVTPDGDVTSCYEIARPEDPLSGVFIYGHFDVDSGQPVLNEEKRRRLHDLATTLREECVSCFCRWHCAGDCPAKWLQPDAAAGARARCHVTRRLTLDEVFAVLDQDGSGGDAQGVPSGA
jgi:uncharacterized protein